MAKESCVHGYAFFIFWFIVSTHYFDISYTEVLRSSLNFVFFLYFSIFCFSHHLRQEAKQGLKQAAINAGKEPEYRLLSPEERKKAEEEWMVVKDKEKNLGSYTLK